MLETTLTQNGVGWSKWWIRTGISDMMLRGSPEYWVGSNTARVENRVTLRGRRGAGKHVVY